MMKNLEDNMSNLTSCVSNEASVSSTNDILTPLPPKKKRNQPGHPDPNAEVIALSPKTLLTTNRFVCEICNKGFQRDQNLQLHRRGHNLPWKLKQRSASSSKEALRKKVYVCPETKCVHHDPSRALGDLTGIKKHFSRKHGEKKWKCDKCSKKYAVQSDWKAHSKICGTREYRCECGTLFSRRDNFITHRAFCDALSQRNATRHITIPVQQVQCPQGTITNNATPHHQIIHQSQLFNNHSINNNNMNIIQNKFPSPIKKEPQNLTLRSEIPPWLSPSPNIGPSLCGPPPSAAPTVDCNAAPPSSIIFHHFQRPNPNYPNNPTRGLPSPAGGLIMPPQQGDHGHHPELDLSSSRDHEVMMNYGNSNNNDDTKAGGGTDTVAVTGGGEIGGLHQFPCSSPLVFLHGFEGQGFEESLRFQSAIDEQVMMSSSSRNHSCIQGSTTRDFLGLGETDLFNFSNYFMDNSNNNSQMNQAQKSWQG